jgi:nitroreductase
MDVYRAIEKRRAYRSLEEIEITEETIKDLAYYASLAPSCYNNQPWRFVFVKSPEKLKEIFSVLPKGNAWATSASMIIAVYSKRDFDCVIGEREYYLFDTGMATAFMILRATEIGLVMHPIAGYDHEKAKKILDIPEDMLLITLVVVGKHSDKISDLLSDKQKQQEIRRPGRKKFEEIARVI